MKENMAIKVIIPEEIKHNITSQIDIVLKELEDTPRYNKVFYCCKYKGVDVFRITWEVRPRYWGFPPHLLLYPSGKIEWKQDFDTMITIGEEARRQAPSVFPPRISSV